MMHYHSCCSASLYVQKPDLATGGRLARNIRTPHEHGLEQTVQPYMTWLVTDMLHSHLELPCVLKMSMLATSCSLTPSRCHICQTVQPEQILFVHVCLTACNSWARLCVQVFIDFSGIGNQAVVVIIVFTCCLCISTWEGLRLLLLYCPCFS